MKRAPKGKSLVAENAKAIKKLIADGAVHGGIADLLIVLAEVCDTAIAGDDIYVTLGMTKRRSALLLTVTWDNDKLVLSGESLVDLADQAHSLL